MHIQVILDEESLFYPDNKHSDCERRLARRPRSQQRDEEGNSSGKSTDENDSEDEYRSLEEDRLRGERVG